MTDDDLKYLRAVGVLLRRGYVISDESGVVARAADEIERLRDALESVWLWMENQSDGQSKGGHATFDLMMLREQRDIVAAALKQQGGERA